MKLCSLNTEIWLCVKSSKIFRQIRLFPEATRPYDVLSGSGTPSLLTISNLLPGFSYEVSSKTRVTGLHNICYSPSLSPRKSLQANTSNLGGLKDFFIIHKRSESESPSDGLHLPYYLTIIFPFPLSYCIKGYFMVIFTTCVSSLLP